MNNIMARELTGLKRGFYSRDTLIVAQELLGKYLVCQSSKARVIGEIVETEAYVGPNDAASHAYRGRRTARTEIQYGSAGFAYIFSIYGTQSCFCIVTERAGIPCVVLIRALKPISGIEIMARRRGILLERDHSESNRRKLISLCNGPSKLCLAMGISKDIHYGMDLCSGVIHLAHGVEIKSCQIAITKRINIDYAGEAKDYPWRYCVSNCEYVSIPQYS
jgi:DNA-3-methyladenine glycosylase